MQCFPSQSPQNNDFPDLVTHCSLEPSFPLLNSLWNIWDNLSFSNMEQVQTQLSLGLLLNVWQSMARVRSSMSKSCCHCKKHPKQSARSHHLGFYFYAVLYSTKMYMYYSSYLIDDIFSTKFIHWDTHKLKLP